MSRTLSAWPWAMSMVMYSGTSFSAASWSTVARSGALTPNEIEAYTPWACKSRTSLTLSMSKRCIT